MPIGQMSWATPCGPKYAGPRLRAGWRNSPKRDLCDVGSSHPGRVAAAKGRVVRPLKGNVSWVQTVVRQVGLYPQEVSAV